MAAVSATISTATLSPSTPQDTQNPWDFAVPVSAQEPSAKHPHSQYSSPTKRVLNSKTNGSSYSPTKSQPSHPERAADSFVAQNSYRPNLPDPHYLAPARIDALTRKNSSLSNTSAPDSLLDLYDSRGVNSMDNGERKGASGDTFTNGDNETDSSRWIHRDKLLRIENEELQAAGITIPKIRPRSKSRNGRSRSRDLSGNGNARNNEYAAKRQRVALISAPDAENKPLEEERQAWDLRSPEEVAEDYKNLYSNQIRSSSRIPVSKASPSPIPIDYLEREVPRLRRRPSGPLDDESIIYPKSRGQSDSVKLLDSAPAAPAPAASSPVKKKEYDSPTKKPPPAQTRKTTAPRQTSGNQRTKTRGPSGGSIRPTPRAGEVTSTAKRPEGDPPWLATMYKPDPRLPPDQQLLPTVAKRLQQEQWEKEGKFGTAYDRDFRPLNDDEFHTPPQSRTPEPFAPQMVETKPQPGPENEWPLQSPKSPALSTGRPGTATGPGSYSTMPRIQGKPQGLSPTNAPEPFVVHSPPQPEPKKKGGCGCCSVM